MTYKPLAEENISHHDLLQPNKRHFRWQALRDMKRALGDASSVSGYLNGALDLEIFTPMASHALFFTRPKTTLGWVKLREHPALVLSGVPSWPPVWIHTRSDPVRKVYGEVGILTGAMMNEHIWTAIFLRMTFEHEAYMGFLGVNDAVFCLELNTLLQNHIGRAIAAVGDIDVSFML